MIFDDIRNAKRYYCLGKGIETALRYIEQYDAKSHEAGRVELEPEKIMILKSSYTTAKPIMDVLETHKRFIDIMYVVEGEERFFHKFEGELEKERRPYDSSADATLGPMEDSAVQGKLSPANFAVFFPQDAHLAGQIWDEPSNVKKLVIKVSVETL